MVSLMAAVAVLLFAVPVQAQETDLKVNFQPSTAATPDGYVADTGQGYQEERGYGWVQPGTSTPVGLTGQSRERDLNSDKRLDTFVIMQPGPGNTALTAGLWERAVPDGFYEVTLSVGDPEFINSVHRVNVEGVNAIDDFVPGGANGSNARHKSASVTVNVTDGRLTVDASGGDQTKINYVDISKVSGPAGPGEIEVENLDATRVGGAPAPGLYDDWMVFSRINGGVTTHKFHDVATLRIRNTDPDDALVINRLQSSDTTEFVLPNGEGSALPITVAPNGSRELDVKFVENSGGKGIRKQTLTIGSNDADEPEKVVQLRGAYMQQPEGGNEVSATQIADAMGYRTEIGEPLTEKPTSPIAGDEVRSPFWKRADSGKPVYVKQLAAYHGCCGAEDNFEITGTGGGSFRHAAAYGQSMLPLKSGSAAPAEMTINPSSTRFEIKAAGYTTNSSGNLGVRTWPVFDRDGERVTDAWFVIQDFVQNGCGSGSANCDYQDNIYLVTNVRPEKVTAPRNVSAAPADNRVDLSWKPNVESDLAGYNVYRGMSEQVSTSGAPLNGSTPLTGTSYTDRGVTNGNTYYYVVQAVDRSGTKTSSAAVRAVPAEPTVFTDLKVNFQPDGATVPSGYAKDSGQAFDPTRGYGWVTPETSNPVSKTADTRERVSATPDQRLNTLIIMQPGVGNAAITDGSWEMAVPDGTYRVTLSVGDAGFTNSTHRVNVEGVNAINDFKPTDADKFEEATVTANVTDGRLTVDALGGDQTKIDYVDVASSDGADCAPYSELPCDEVATDLPLALDWQQDEGRLADGDGQGTGFTLTQPSSKGGQYLPDNLDVDPAKGAMTITTTGGIQSRDVNNLDNALGTAFDVSGPTRIGTTLVNPPLGTASLEQGGLWFGPDEDNFVKLVVGSFRTGTKVHHRLQFVREVNGASTTTDEINTTDSNLDFSSSTVRLILDADPSGKVTAFYALPGEAERKLGDLTVPGNFFDGTKVDSRIGAKNLAGVFATQRNATAPVDFAFGDFTVTPEDVGTPEIEDPEPSELVFSGTKNSTSATQSVSVRNTGDGSMRVSGATLTGTNASAFRLVDAPRFPLDVPVGGSATFKVQFAPGTSAGSLEAALDIASDDADEGTVSVGLYGLSANGEQGSNEPPLQQVVDTLGHPIDVGGDGLILGTNPAPIGDEVGGGLFEKAGTGPVGIKPVARYSPDQTIPFGYYTADSSDKLTRTGVAVIDRGQEQTLNPSIVSGGASSFDPGNKSFGFYTQGLEDRLAYSQDKYNVVITGKSTAHAVRSYPAKDRSGRVIQNAYIVAFEDATNGDYQDYVFLVTGVSPSDGNADELPEKINFQPKTVNARGEGQTSGGTPVPVPDGYTPDYGDAFDADRGYGWISADTGKPVDARLNTRYRAASGAPSDLRLATQLQMQGTGGANQPVTNGAWEMAVPDGFYTVKVSAGDQPVDSTHRINVEEENVIDSFTPTGQYQYRTGNATVEVTDGRLTVDAKGGKNTKINYVDIQPASPPPNTAPSASGDSYAVNEDARLDVTAEKGVLANDTDADSDSLTAKPGDTVGNGTLSLNPDGSFSYQPGPGFSGTDSFTYRASDGEADSSLATVDITVNATNDPPALAPIGDQTVEAGQRKTVGISATDPDAGDAIKLTAEGLPGFSTLTDNGDGTGSLTLAPGKGIAGNYEVTVTASDSAVSDSETFSITVTEPPNQAPVTADDSYSIDEDTRLDVTAEKGVLVNDTDADGDDLEATLIEDVKSGTLSLNPDGSFLYQPDAGFSGGDSFTYKASDGEADSRTTTVGITVNAVEDTQAPAPVTGFAAKAGDGGATLSWKNPPDDDFKEVLILRSESGHTASPEPTASQQEAYRGSSTSFEDTNLTNGKTYYYTAFAVDEAGNWSTKAETIARPVAPPPPDTTAPNTVITGGPASLTSSRTARFTFTSNEAGSTFECRLDGGTFAACPSPELYSGLGDGGHTFHVRATDRSGNTGDAVTRSWTVDTKAPIIRSLTPKPDSSTRDRTPTISAIVQDRGSQLSQADIKLYVDGKPVKFKYSATKDRLTYTARQMKLGKHTVRLVATDGASNNTTEVWKFSVRKGR